MWLTEFDLPSGLDATAKWHLVELFNDCSPEQAVASVRWLTFNYTLLPAEILEKLVQPIIKLLHHLSFNPYANAREAIVDVSIALYIVGGEAATEAVKNCLRVESELPESTQVIIERQMHWQLPSGPRITDQQRLEIILVALDSNHRLVVKYACYRSSYMPLSVILVEKLISTSQRAGLKGANIYAYSPLARYDYTGHTELRTRVYQFLKAAGAKHQKAYQAFEFLDLRVNPKF